MRYLNKIKRISLAILLFVGLFPSIIFGADQTFRSKTEITNLNEAIFWVIINPDTSPEDRKITYDYLKAQLETDGHATITGTETFTNKTLTSPVINSPTGIVKGDVGLGNVDNTADTDKPVSTAGQTALNLKQNVLTEGVFVDGDKTRLDQLGSTDDPAFNSVHASGGNLAAANAQVTKKWITGLDYTADVTSVIHGAVHYICSSTHTADSTTEPGVGASWATVWISTDTLLSDKIDEDGTIPLTANWNAGDFIITSGGMIANKDTGVAGLTYVYEATDTDYIGIMGPASISESWSAQYPNAQPNGQIPVYGLPAGTGDPNGEKVSAIMWVSFPVNEAMAISDESTDLTTGTAKLTWRPPFAFTLTEVRAYVSTAPTGAALIIDINESGTTVLQTKITIDETEKTSETAVTAPVISDSAIADDAEITIDIDQIGSTIAGKGAKIWLIGTRAL